MNLVREGSIYVNNRIGRALSLAAKVIAGDGTASVEALAQRYLEEGLNREYPGIFQCIDECEAGYKALLNENKKRADAWTKTLIKPSA